MKSALIVWGGWDGHTPQQTAQTLADGLRKKGFDVTVETALDSWANVEKLKSFDLLVPIWTMGKAMTEQMQGLDAAVKSGVGLAGVHGGMADAFRGQIDYEWMVGGIFVGHPHVGEYTVQLTDRKDPITDGLPHTFPYKSEQYYMLTDPGNRVLAETLYERDGRRVAMPVVWTKSWGKGRVFFSSLGHVAAEFTQYPQVLEMTVRGLVWAAEGKTAK
jgi:type 1 glutamine amidotransferase